MTKLPNDRKCLIKDLELQIDYLIGYRPSGSHWKIEYHIRQELLEETVSSDQTPPEVIDKIARIQDTLFALYQKERHKQGYLAYTQQEYVKGKQPHPPIKTYRWVDGQKEYYYL